MKGAVITIARQIDESLQWAGQDQNYLPRLINYLKLAVPDAAWQILPGHEVEQTDLSEFQVIALPPVAQKFEKQIKAAYPTISIIKPTLEDFMYMMAPKSMVVGHTTGYLIATGPKITQSKVPSDSVLQKFTNENLRQLMREQPNVLWQVATFDEVKEHLQKQPSATVALTPQASLYEKFLTTTFPETTILQITPNSLAESPRQLELLMLATGLTTMLLLGLMVLF